MRVLIYSDSDVFAGTERHMAELVKNLASRGIDVCVACPSPSPLASSAENYGVATVTLPKTGIVDFPAVRILRRLLRSGRIDVIHAHNGRTALAAALAVRLAGRGRCVVTQHFLAPSHTSRTGPKAMISRLAHGWVDGHTHAHIAISRAVYDSMIARGESTADEITVIPNGITLLDPAALAPPTQIREQLKVSDDAVLIVCACRLEAEKDVMTLIEAMPLLCASPPVKLAIVGSGSLEAELRNKIRDWQLNDCTSLLGFRNDVLSIIAAADIFVLPSKAEPFGLAILEAMSLAKPVIATAAGGPLEIVVDGETGLLVPPNDPAALASALQTLTADPATRAAMGCKGLKRFRECFTADRMCDEIINVYQRVLGVAAEKPGLTARAGEAAAVH